MERRAAGGRSQKGLKQAPMQNMSFEQEFRMPLQAQEESVRRMFNRLDDSVGGCRAGNEGRSDHFHRLVM